MTQVALFWAALGRRGSGDGEDQGDLTVNATVLSESGDEFRRITEMQIWISR